VDRIVRERRRMAASLGADDLIGRLLSARDPVTGQGLSDAEVREQVLLFLLAGHETTATALTFTLHLLGHHPDAQQRVRDEVQQVLGGRAPTAEDAAQLTYTTRVIKEAMRLYPPAWSIARRTGHDLTIGGYQLPAASAVILSAWAIHRHPQHWDRPAIFDPDRFTPEREAARHRYAYLPLGAGPRACIGSSFALLEACWPRRSSSAPTSCRPPLTPSRWPPGSPCDPPPPSPAPCGPSPPRTAPTRHGQGRVDIRTKLALVIVLAMLVGGAMVATVAAALPSRSSTLRPWAMGRASPPQPPRRPLTKPG
jgi:Cytochrome P450